jgi:hypothetical protein
MRSREEIENGLENSRVRDEYGRIVGYKYPGINDLQIELLLDIRELLTPKAIQHFPQSAEPPLAFGRGNTSSP